MDHCVFIALCTENAMNTQRACYIVIVICNERAVILRQTIAYPLQFHNIPLQKFQLLCRGFTAIPLPFAATLQRYRYMSILIWNECAPFTIDFHCSL